MNGKISFSSDIRPLFTDDDIAGMRPQGIDLAAVEDVRGHALRILARLAEKTMPPRAAVARRSGGAVPRLDRRGMAA